MKSQLITIIGACIVSWCLGFISGYSNSINKDTQIIECDPNQSDWITYDPNIVYLDGNEPNLLHIDPNDMNNLTSDGGLAADFNWYPETVEFCIGQDTYAKFQFDGNDISCNVTREKFIRDLPKCLYNVFTGDEPNSPVNINWPETFIAYDPKLNIDPNDFMSCCIALGYKAGYYWTTEKRMFAVSLPNTDGTYTEYSTQMTEDEYLNVYHVVNRALKNKRILEP